MKVREEKTSCKQKERRSNRKVVEEIKRRGKRKDAQVKDRKNQRGEKDSSWKRRKRRPSVREKRPMKRSEPTCLSQPV